MTNDAEHDRLRKEGALSQIVGARLTSVQFVLDYLILGFDERGALTTLVWPEVSHGGKKWTLGAPGYRDELCLLIERIVAGAVMESDETISISFDNGADLRIPLRSYKASGERAILTGPKHYLFVF